MGWSSRIANQRFGRKAKPCSTEAAPTGHPACSLHPDEQFRILDSDISMVYYLSSRDRIPVIMSGDPHQQIWILLLLCDQHPFGDLRVETPA